jgi:uncharacterized protein with HEPN domain
MKDDNVYLQHIAEAIVKIESYTAGLTEDSFIKTPLVQDGVIRQFEIIGEATKHLSVGTRERADEIPWRVIAGMRDTLIHEYFGISMKMVWETVVHDVPLLKAEVQKLLA